jgi:gliding motility-associated-like protein
VNPTKAITTQPLSHTKCQGDNLVLSIAATGNNLTFRWRKNGGDLSDVGSILGSGTSTLTISSLIPNDAGTYTCVVSGTCGGDLTSDAAVLVVNRTTTITSPATVVTQAVCQGESSTLTVTATGDNLTYLWKKSGNAITGANISGVNTNQLVISNALVTDGGVYTCTVSGVCGSSLTSNTFTLTVNPTKAITTQPISRIKCEGDNVTFTVVASGGNLGYRWWVNGALVSDSDPNITGWNLASLNISNLLPAYAGNYICVITGDCGGAITSDAAVLQVNPTTRINTQTTITNGTICQGTSTTLSVVASGNNLVYQWRKNGEAITGTNISGVNTNTMVIANALLADAGVYSCLVTGNCGSPLASNPVTLTVNPTKTITTQPLSRTLCVGDNATFTVAATGSNLHYQWKRGAANVGTDSPTLTINGVALTDAGNYTCVVSGDCGGDLTSDVAVLTVKRGTAFDPLAPASSTSVCQGESASFSVNATGENITYLWTRNGEPITATNISGKTTNLLVISNATAANAGVYTCTITGDCGSPLTSNTFTLTVNPTKAITTQPLSRIKCEGDNVVFTIAASGNNLSYQWYRDITTIGLNSPTLTINNLQTTDAGNYTCVVTGDCGDPITSDAAVLSVNKGTSFDPLAPASSTTLCQGESTSFAVNARGDNLTYLWRKNGEVITNTNVSGQATNQLVIANAQAANVGIYTCTITGICGSPLTSNTFTLTVNPTMALVTQPISRTKCEGDNVVFTVVASGNNLSYQWYRGTSTVGTNSPTITISNLTTADAGNYTCLVTGDCGGTITSDVAVLNVNKGTSITPLTVIGGTTLCQGASTSISITATGNNLSYEWKRNGNPITASNISGKTTNLLVISNATLDNAGDYTCTVSGDCGSVLTSNIVTIAVNPTTAITGQPLGGEKCQGDEIIFTVYATGHNLNYQWFRGTTSLTNGGNIAGANTSQLKVSMVNPNPDAGTYTCVVTGTCGTITSEPAVLTVSNTTTLSGNPVLVNPNLCEGESTTITISASGDNLLYQWKRNGQPIASGGNITGINTNVLTISNAIVDNAGDYTCTVVGKCGSMHTSNIATLNVYPTTTITSSPVGGERCQSDQITFSVTATGNNLSYRWYKNSIDNPPLTNGAIASGAFISGANTPQLTISNLFPDESGSYICVVSGTCQTGVASIPALLTVNGRVNIQTHPNSEILCQGASINISVVASGTVLQYRWKKDGEYITNSATVTGTSTSVLSIANALATDAGYYACEIVGTCNTTESQVSQVIVNPTPKITRQPIGTTLCEGDSYQLITEGSGKAPLAYQWYFNNTAIPGATNSIYTLNGITNAQAGAYTVQVNAAACGSDLSTAANILVNPKITISTQPVSAIICEDNTAMFAVDAAGTGSLVYRWMFKNEFLVDDGRIAGANTNQLTVFYATKLDEGIYKLRIHSTCGTRESSEVTLSVVDSTKITAHPVSQTLLLATTPVSAHFNVEATGANLKYQWQKDEADIAGAISKSYSITDVQLTDAGRYRCVVTGNCGDVLSKTAFLVVNEPAAITSAPLVDQTVCAGQSATFTVTANGTITSYQWLFNGVNLVDGNGVSGANSSVLVISPAAAVHNGNYRCIITGSYNQTATTNTAKLTVNELVTITQSPASRKLCYDEWLILEVTATGNNITYEWKKNGQVLDIADTRITGIFSNKLTIANIDDNDAGEYFCVVTNSCDSKESKPALVSISPKVRVTATSSNQVRCQTQSVSFTINTNVPYVTYQWYKGITPLTNTSRINGVNTADLTINNLNTDDEGKYSCRITDNCTNDNSDEISLTVRKLTIIEKQPKDTMACEGGAALFEVIASGSALSYQWLKNGIPLTDIDDRILGSRTNVLTISNAQISDNGVYRCLISGGCNDERTNPNTLTVNAYPGAALLISGLSTVCQGAKAIHYVIPEIENAQTYVWEIPYGAEITTGQGTRSIQVNYMGNSLSGQIRVYAQNGCGNGTASPVLNVTVNPMPIAYAGVDSSVCRYSSRLVANNVAGGRWTIKTGDAVLENENNYSTDVSLLRRGLNTFVWTVTQNGCTATDEVNITNLKIDVHAGTNQVVCSKEANLNAITPKTGASWNVIEGYGTIVTPSSPTSSVTGLSQGVNRFAWQVVNLGCTSSHEITITNNQPLPPDAGEDQIIAFDETDLTAKEPETGTNGYWKLISGGGFFDDATNPKTKIRRLMPGPNVIVWTVQRENCTRTDTIYVENILLEPANAGKDQTLCVNYTTLTAKTPPIGVGEWSIPTGSATILEPSNPNSKVTNLAPGTNILRWTVKTSMLGSTSSDVTIINNMPTPSYAGSDRFLCTNVVNLSATPAEWGTGRWTQISGSSVIADINSPTTSLSNLAPGVNILKWTIDNNGCTSEDLVTITNNKPTVAQAGDDQVICKNFTELLPNAPTFGVGTWSVDAGRGDFSGNNVINLVPGTNRYIYTIKQGDCTSKDTVTIINNKPTTPIAGYDESLCVDSVDLKGNRATEGAGLWSIRNGAGTFSDITNHIPKVTNLAFGTNVFRWTITNNGCEEYDEVIISNNFVKADAGGSETLCQGFTELRASNPSPGIGTWSVQQASSALFDNRNSPNTTVRNLSKGPNVFRWTVQNKNCVDFADVTITNNEPSTPFAGEDQSVCSKEATLTATTVSYGEGVWTAMSGSASFVDDKNPKTNITNLAEGPNILRWTVTMENCTRFDEVIISSNLPENVFAGNDQLVCSSTATLGATPPTLGSGRWEIVSGSGNFTNRFQNNTPVNNLGKGDNVFRWTVSSADCHVADEVTIRSSIPSTSIAGTDQILCTDSTELGGNTPVFGTGRWTVVSGSVSFRDQLSPRTFAVDIAHGTNVVAWVIDMEGCQSISTLTLQNNQPSIPFAGYDKSICGDSIRLSANLPEIGIGRWSTFGDALILNPTSHQSRVVNMKYGKNTFRWTVTNQNCVLTDAVDITSDLAYVFAGRDTTINTSSIQLIGNVPEVGIGTWSLITGSERTVIDSPNNYTTSVNNLAAGPNVFRWTIMNNQCPSFDEVTVNYIVWPVVDFEPSSLTGCPPFEVNFRNKTTGGSPYRWDFGDGSPLVFQQHVAHTYTLPGKYTVTLTATAPGTNNTVSKQRLITVNTLPKAKFEIAPRTTYLPGQHISCFNQSFLADTSFWNFGDGRAIVKSFAPTYTYKDTGLFDVTLKIINRYGCLDSITILSAVHVLPRSKFYFPQAFTPNPYGPSGGVYSLLDRSNDVFFPIVIDGEITNFEMKIFNRSGVMVFKTDDINIGWDGYYKNKLLPQGIYVYSVSGRFNNGEPFTQAGTVLLIVKQK